MHVDQIQIRDPFFLTDREDGCYYLYGSTDKDIWRTGISFEGYRTVDFVEYEGPYTLFENSGDFWAETNFWAPEVHVYRGKYYMLATFWGSSFGRGTQILRADEPLGRYVPLTAYPVTPAGWGCLDGTLFVEDGRPWIVFCHEWMQITDGTICAMPLTGDLTAANAPPVTLFSAGSCGWAHSFPPDRPGAYVTDGPFLRKTGNGSLILLWSSFIDGRYALGQARAAHGVAGEYEHLGPLYTDDGGHGMIFETLEGRLLLSLHSPNETPRERIRLIRLRDAGDCFELD